MNRQLFRPPAKPARTLDQLRGEWANLIALAGTLAKDAADPLSAAPDFRQRLTRLTVALRDVRVDSFPTQGPAVVIIAGPFLNLARNFCHPGLEPTARTACAPMLLEGARALQQIMSQGEG